MTDDATWRRCSACRNPISLGATHWVCSVSTCNRKRTGMVFCSVECWEVHLPVAKHRDAWAVEKTAPTTREAAEPASGDARSASPARPREPRRVIATPPAPARGPASTSSELPSEVLIIASRLKDYIRARSGFNTSERVLDPLSDIVRRVCDEAIRNASRDGRKTVLDRDVPRR